MTYHALPGKREDRRQQPLVIVRTDIIVRTDNRDGDVSEVGDQVGHSQPRAVSQQRAGDTQGEGPPSAQCGQLVSRATLLDHSLVGRVTIAKHTAEELYRVRGGESTQLDDLMVNKIENVPSGRHQYPMGRVLGQQGGNLIHMRDVIEHQEYRFSGFGLFSQHAVVNRGLFAERGGELLSPVKSDK